MALISGRGDLAQEVGKHAGLRYSLDPDDYVELCVACHRDYDESLAEYRFRSHDA